MATIVCAGRIFRRANRGAAGAGAGTADIVLVVLAEGIHVAHRASGWACVCGREWRHCIGVQCRQKGTRQTQNSAINILEPRKRC